MSRNKHTERCDWAESNIEPYVDGALDDEKSAAMAAHLDACARCRSELDMAVAIKSGLAAIPPEVCPDRVTRRVFEKVEGAAGSPARTPNGRRMGLIKPIWRPVAVAAAAAAIIVVILSAPFEPQVTHSEAEIERALQEAKYAIAVLSDAGRRAGAQVATDVETTVLEPMRKVLDEDKKSNL